MKKMEEETFTSKNGRLTWKVISKELRRNKNGIRAYFTVVCAKCGFKIKGTKGNIQSRATCAGCSKKPSALKTDEGGNCIAVCDIGITEFVRQYQAEHNASEREAVRQFIETAKVHLLPGDPIAEKLTEESVGAKVRRMTGKKKDISKDCGGPPHKKRKELDLADMDSKARAIAVVNKYTPKEYFKAEDYIRKAIILLEGIAADDPNKDIWALKYIIDWCITQIDDPRRMNYLIMSGDGKLHQVEDLWNDLKRSESR